MNDTNVDGIRRRYALVPRTLIFIQKDDKILLMKRGRKDSFGYGKINGLGGHIEKGEEPYEAALREIREEAQIHISDLEMTTMLFIDIRVSPGILVFVFKAQYEGGDFKSSDEGDLCWLTREEISKNEMVVKDLPYLVHICDNHKKGNPPEMLKYLYTDQELLRIVKKSD